jgi:hypothetical protein
MRSVAFILAASVGLIVTSCGGSDQPGSQAKTVATLKPHDLIVGVWQIKKDDPLEPFIVSFEFAANNTLKMHCQGAKEPIKGKYTFVNDYAIEVEYEATEEARKAYAAAVKGHKSSGVAAAKSETGEIPPQIQGAMAGMFGRIPDQLPAKEKLQIAVKSVSPGGTQQPGERSGFEMLLENEKQYTLRFRKAE